MRGDALAAIAKQLPAKTTKQHVKALAALKALRLEGRALAETGILEAICRRIAEETDWVSAHDLHRGMMDALGVEPASKHELARVEDAAARAWVAAKDRGEDPEGAMLKVFDDNLTLQERRAFAAFAEWVDPSVRANVAYNVLVGITMRADAERGRRSLEQKRDAANATNKRKKADTERMLELSRKLRSSFGIATRAARARSIADKLNREALAGDDKRSARSVYERLKRHGE